MDQTIMRQLIARKRDGAELAGEDWAAIVHGFMGDTIDDAQMAALAMACVWRGFTLEEAYALTRAMVDSGETLSFSGRTVVDKHSSGGVSDIVSMLVVPIVAACGVPVAKLSGRALGHTGGTIDKLEAIPGFNVDLSTDQFLRQVEQIGCAIAAQTQTFVPADKRLYKLRDHTATVPSMGLMASSIVSKKIAGGAQAFVFDVKAGRAAFMPTPEEASVLARWLVQIAARFQRRAMAVVSDMNQPLGISIGTGIEVIEARDFLRGLLETPRARELCLSVADTMLGVVAVSGGRALAQRALESGTAYEKFVEMVCAQGGTRAGLESMRVAEPITQVCAERSGYIAGIDAVALGNAGRALSSSDSCAGIRVRVTVGDVTRRGDVLAEYCGAAETPAHIADSFTIGEDPVPPLPLVYGIVGEL
ncbi:MAG: thymidine phosphorylase [Candidatus Baltobacteraceae bacterium]